MLIVTKVAGMYSHITTSSASAWLDSSNSVLYALDNPNHGYYASVPIDRKDLDNRWFTRDNNCIDTDPYDRGVYDFSDYGFKLSHSGLTFNQI